MGERKKLNGYYNYTVVLTYMGMLIGLLGIAFAMDDKFQQAMVCLMGAGFCDMFDGAVAATRERTDSEKRFGIQIDSLSDLICFGVLPALLTYCLCGKTFPAMMAAGLYALCALIRLAYFNVMEEERQERESGRRTSYQGLPVTTAAVGLPLFYILVGFLSKGVHGVLETALTVMAVAFVLPFPVRKPHTTGKLMLMVVGVAEFVLLLLGLGL